MSTSPMVEQVNRMVGNLLAWSGEVALPGIGSLYVERQTAKRLSKRSVLPPCRTVSFTSQMRGASLADEIARVAQCDAAQAKDIYERWLARTQEGDVLTIEGVGELKFKNFTLDPAFDRLLNPQGHEPVRIKSARRFDWVLWFGVTVIVLVAAGGAALWMTDGSLLAGFGDMWRSDEPTVVMTEPAPEKTAPADEFAVSPEQDMASAQASAGNAAQTTDGLPVAESGVQHAAVQPAPPVSANTASGTPDVPAEFTAGHRYVVLGVFSTAENAARAIRDAVSKDAAIRCSVYRFGVKLMVSPFSSADAETCTQFIRDKAESFPGMWTYTAK